uniref:G patch domain-containing protein 4 n=1 Tax=Taeniopygia guttata TaxID=59729 RepID=H0YZK8_TAEGU
AMSAAEPPGRGMLFAETQLRRHGWRRGQGLGRREDGIAEAIRVKVKCDTAGVGHDAAEPFTFHWWDHVFNQAAANIAVEAGQVGGRKRRRRKRRTRKSRTKRSQLKQMYLSKRRMSETWGTALQRRGRRRRGRGSQSEKCLGCHTVQLPVPPGCKGPDPGAGGCHGVL